MTTLYDYWRSSASYRVRIALGLAGLDWDSVPIDLVAGVQRGDAHRARNPQGLVPALDVDGHTLTQSLAIIEYLDETRGLGFLPKDPVGRARVRALAYAVAMEIHPICNLRVAKYAVAQSGDKITMASWMQHFIGAGFTDLEAMLPDTGPYCDGETVTLADICLVPQVYNAHRWEVDMAPYPKIRAIADALAALPAVQAAHPDRTPH